MYVYIHIPFCSNICSYCDFPKVLYDKKYTNNYLKTLREEIETRYKDEEVVSIFIGGGTPTSLDTEELKELLEITTLFRKKASIEFTIESNVESLSLEKIKLLHQFGVNRISLGVQSFHEKTLKELNRHHTKEMVEEVIAHLKEEGIFNISIDYIYGVSSNLKEIAEDLNTFFTLDIPHISCYSLIIEEGTLFGIKKREYIDEDLEVKMYQYIESTLTSKQYQHYEVSNYSRSGYQSKHNLNYWNNGDYYGFGMGAVSYLAHERITNTRNLTKYLNHQYLEKKEFENESLQISNEFILGLRKIEGLSIVDFEKKYHQSPLAYPSVKKLLAEKKLELSENFLRIPKHYFYLSNEILIEFI